MPSLVNPVNWQPLTLDGVNLEDVQSFIYLGSTIRPSGQGAAEVDHRIETARSAFVRHYGGDERYPRLPFVVMQKSVIKPLSGRSSSMTAKRGRFERLTYESLKCSTTIAFVTFCDAAESIVCPQLLYVVTWTSVLFHPSCPSAVPDGSGTQLDALRESSFAMYFSLLLFLTGENVSVGSWRRGPAQSRMT